MKFSEIDNPIHAPAIALIKAVANAVTIDNELKKSPYRVVGMTILVNGEVPSATEGLSSVLSKSIGLRIEYQSAKGKEEKTLFVIEYKE